MTVQCDGMIARESGVIKHLVVCALMTIVRALLHVKFSGGPEVM